MLLQVLSRPHRDKSLSRTSSSAEVSELHVDYAEPNPACRRPSIKLSQMEHPSPPPSSGLERGVPVFCCLCLLAGGCSCSSSFLHHTGLVSKSPSHSLPLWPPRHWSWASLHGASALLGASVPTAPVPSTALEFLLLCSWTQWFPFSCSLSFRLKKNFVIFHPRFLCILQQEDFWKERLHVFQLPKLCQTLIHHCLLPCPFCPAGSCLLSFPPRRNRGKHSRQNTHLSGIPAH